MSNNTSTSSDKITLIPSVEEQMKVFEFEQDMQVNGEFKARLDNIARQSLAPAVPKLVVI